MPLSAELVASGEHSPGRVVRLVSASRPAIVLGSGQPAGHVDTDRLAAAGFELARRRSGGSAVVVGDERSVWVDIVVPAEDSLWHADVGRASWWLGQVWADALADLGADGLQVWRAAMVRTRWADRVCFAGVGPGEVVGRVGTGGKVVGRAGAGGKVVGIAERRTRAATLLQSAALLEWDPRALIGVLALTPEERADAAHDLPGLAGGARVGSDVEVVFAAFLHRLERYGPLVEGRPDGGR